MPLTAASKARAHARWRELCQWTMVEARWFTPDALGYENGVPPLPLTKRAFFTRAMSGVQKDYYGGLWADRNRLTTGLNFSHNLSQVFGPKLYSKYPEFFPEEDGQRLQPKKGTYWWNPDLGREDTAAWAAQAARDFFNSKPTAVSFALGVNDGLVFGDSVETRALTVPVRWFRERPDYSNLVFTFMNRAAADLARTHPDKYLGTLAYYWAEDVPDFPVHPQVVPFLTADRSQGYDRDFLREDRALQKRWIATMRAGAQAEGHRNSTPRIGLYDYIYGGGFLVPRYHPHLLAEHLRYTRRLGFTDYYAEVYPNWGLDGPQPWLVAQLLQDPEQSADKLLSEYFRRFFKEAAGPMRRFFMRCEQQWLRQKGPAYWLKHYRNQSQAALFPSGVCKELHGLLAAATGRAKSDLVRARVRQVSDAFGVTERFVDMQEARDLTARLALADNPDAARVRQAVDAFAMARSEFERYTRSLQREQPALIAPFSFMDFLVDDPTAMALAAVAKEPANMGTPWRSIEINGSLLGQQHPARRIAELTYGVALPAGWNSKVEPSEHHRAEVHQGILSIMGTKDTTIFRWVPLPTGSGMIRAKLDVRGEVPVSGVVSLTLGWLDVQQRHLGLTVVRLPEGKWPEWRTLLQVAKPPTGAAWVGIGLRVQNQQSTSEVEFRNFMLEFQP